MAGPMIARTDSVDDHRLGTDEADSLLVIVVVLRWRESCRSC